MVTINFSGGDDIILSVIWFPWQHWFIGLSLYYTLIKGKHQFVHSSEILLIGKKIFAVGRGGCS